MLLPKNHLSSDFVQKRKTSQKNKTADRGCALREVEFQLWQENELKHFEALAMMPLVSYLHGSTLLLIG